MKRLARQLGYGMILLGSVWTIARYFLNLGLRDVAMVAMATAIGDAWRKRTVEA